MYCSLLRFSYGQRYCLLSRCQSAQIYRHGQNPKGRDRFRCRDCYRVFLLTYTYEARKLGVKAQITYRKISI
uniref:IS1 family transposase n=1 Tax=Pectobacterium quasiaquaticum TaxID=2774015 RepID=UPI00385036C0